VLKAAADAGARSAGYVLLRLPYQIKDLFLDWLKRHFPDRAAHVESAVREMRGGALYSSKFFERQRGQGARAEQIGQAFALFKKRYNLDGHPARMTPQRPPGRIFRPERDGQLPLFGN
jgi:DNA repair photolyase